MVNNSDLRSSGDSSRTTDYYLDFICFPQPWGLCSTLELRSYRNDRDLCRLQGCFGSTLELSFYFSKLRASRGGRFLESSPIYHTVTILNICRGHLCSTVRSSTWDCIHWKAVVSWYVGPTTRNHSLSRPDPLPSPKAAAVQSSHLNPGWAHDGGRSGLRNPSSSRAFSNCRHQ